MKKTLVSASAAALLVLSLGLSKASHARAAAGDQNGSSDQYQIKIDNFSFAPATLTVPAGATVTWVNQDDVPHNIVSTQKKFASPVLDTDEEFSHTFDIAGTYTYYCSIHPKMTGQVVVA